MTHEQQKTNRRQFVATSAQLAAGVACAVSAAGPRCMVFGEEKRTVSRTLTHLSAVSLAQLIRNREVTAEEVMAAHVDVITECNPAIRSIVQFSAENAMNAAVKADKMLKRGESVGPLHGVPVTFKDHLLTVDFPTSAGTAGLKGTKAEKDATVVNRLKQAGAIPLGKTNVSQLCWVFESENDVFGRTNNPYDITRTSGGSSSGEAATIAYGGSPLGIGADGGGSIRLPSHFCGIAGLKPTWSRIPNSGTIGAGPFVGVFFDVLGPMARHVEDLALALQLLAGPDGLDFFTPPVVVREPAEVDLSRLRVAYFTDLGEPSELDKYYAERIPPPADHDTQSVIATAVNSLRVVVRSVVEERPPGIGEAGALGMNLYAHDARRRLEKFFAAHPGDRADRYTEELLSYLDGYAQKGANNLDSLNSYKLRWYEISSAMHTYMQGIDCIIAPVNAGPAMKHGTTTSHIERFMYTAAFNHAGNLPAATVRCGTSQKGNLPIGVQIIAPPWREDIALAVASYLERQGFGGWIPPPKAHSSETPVR